MGASEGIVVGIDAASRGNSKAECRMAGHNQIPMTSTPNQARAASTTMEALYRVAAG